MSLNVLRRYTLNPIQVGDFIEKKDMQGIIEYSADGNITKEGTFLTLNSFNTASEARDYLALTYTPNYESIFSLENQDQEFELKNPYHLQSPSRVWPAFGYHGGACEIILTNGVLKCTTLQKGKFIDGGVLDEFTQDNTKKNSFLEIYLNIILETVIPIIIIDMESNVIGRKIIKGLGIVRMWSEKEKNFSLSCAYKEEVESVRLKFWGTIWVDALKQMKRYILAKPIETEIDPLPYSYESLVNLLRKGQYNEEQELKEALKVIISELKEVSKSFSPNDPGLAKEISLKYPCKYFRCSEPGCTAMATTLSYPSPPYPPPMPFDSNWEMPPLKPYCKNHAHVFWIY